MRPVMITVMLAGVSPLTSDAEGPVNMIGLGSTTCREIVSDYAGHDLTRASIFEWAAGFMTGANIATIVAVQRYKNLEGLILPGETAGNNGVVNPIIRICRQQPDIKLLDATLQVVGQLPQIPWEPEEPE